MVFQLGSALLDACVLAVLDEKTLTDTCLRRA